MRNKDTFLTRIKQSFQVLTGKAKLARKENLQFDVKCLELDENGIITYVNELSEDNLGVSKELIGLKYSSLIYEKDLALKEKHYQYSYNKLIDGGTPNYLGKAVCYRVLHKDGDYHWVCETNIFTLDENNNQIYIMFLLDIKEENLEKIEEKYAKINLENVEEYLDFCESTQNPITVLDRKSLVAGNATLKDLYEDDPTSDKVTIDLSDIMDITEDAIQSLVARALEGAIPNVHFDFIQSNGTRIDIISYVYPLKHLGHVVLIYKIVNIEVADMSKANRLLYSRLFEDNPVPMAIVDYENRLIVTANLAARKLYGYEGVDIRNFPVNKLIGDNFKEFTVPLETILEKGYVFIDEQEHKNKNGDAFYVDIYAFPYLIKDKQMVCYSVSNVTERVENKKQIRKLGIALEHSPNFVVMADKNLNVEYVNNTLLERCGLKTEQAIGRPITQFIADNVESTQKLFFSAIEKGEVKSSDMLCKGCDSKNFWVNMVSAPIKSENGEIIGIVLIGDDLTLQHSYDNEIYKLKLYDNMTGLGNRQYIFNKLEEFFKNADKKAILAIMDLDKLSTINENLGLSSGDEVIKITADRLEEHSDKNDVLARLGNDEFVMLKILDDDEDASVHVENLSKEIIKSFDKPVSIKNHNIVCNISIGLVVLGENESKIKEPENALRCAELAMYKAKETRGISSYYRFSSALMQVAQERFNLEQRLKKALKLNQFVLYYQAKVDLNTNKFSGFEALLRWIDEDGKVVPPLEFIPFAEESGLILPISDWVLEEACKQSVKWEKDKKQAKIAVNISARQFQESDFVKKVEHILRKTGVNPANIELEITESMLIGDMQNALSLLHHLKALGVTLAIDDFGTGYSSFSYIKEMPIDVLKVDKVFIDNLPANKKDCAIATTIITLAKELNILVVAEGIETQNQAQFLQKNHCDYAQGYFYAKPLGIEQIDKIF